MRVCVCFFSSFFSVDAVLIRALRDSNLPKFLAQDVPLFQAILQDLFPSIEIPEADVGRLRLTIEEVLRDRHLQVVPALVLKCVQFYETINVRHGVMLVGPSGGGKTTNYEVLAEALCRLHAQDSAVLDLNNGQADYDQV